MLNRDQLLNIRNEVAQLCFDPAFHTLMEVDAPYRWLLSNFAGVGVMCKCGEGRSQESGLGVMVRAKLPEDLLGSFNVKDFLRKWAKRCSELSDHAWDQLRAKSWSRLWKPMRQDYGELLSESAENSQVLEIGAISSMAGLAGPVNQLTIGADVAMAERATHGTVCAFATSDGRNRLLLSCGHVLDSRRYKFRLVTSHGAVVAKIVKQANLLPGLGLPDGSGTFRQQDATAAELLNDVEPNFELPDHMGRLSSTIPEPPRCCMQVTKAGKTVTDGQVVCTDAHVLVDYPTQTSLLFNQIVVKSSEPRCNDDDLFAQAGDSGALVVTRADCRPAGDCKELTERHHHVPHVRFEILPVGMVVAAGDPATIKRGKTSLPPQYTIVTPMQAILDALQVELRVS